LTFLSGLQALSHKKGVARGKGGGVEATGFEGLAGIDQINLDEIEGAGTAFGGAPSRKRKRCIRTPIDEELAMLLEEGRLLVACDQSFGDVLSIFVDELVKV